MSEMPHGLFELTLQEKKKRCKMSLLRFSQNSFIKPSFSYPNAPIVIKHLKVSLIVYFLRGLPFSARFSC